MSQPSPVPPASAAASPRPLAGLRRYRRHLHHLKPARGYLIGGFLAGLLYSVSTGAGIPFILNYLLPVFFHQEDKIDPLVAEWGRRLLGADYADRLLVVACVGFPLIFALRGLAQFANKYWINQAGFTVLENLRLEAYQRLLTLPMAFHGANQAGDLNARLMNDTEKLRAVVIRVSEIATQPLTLLSALGTLVVLSIRQQSILFALIAILSVPLCVLPIRYAARSLIKRSRQLADKSGDLAAASTETLLAPLEVQAYNLEERQRAGFAARVREILRLSVKTVKYQSLATPVIEFVSVCGLIGAIYFGTRHGMTYSGFLALAGALFFCYEPVKKLSATHAILKTGEASLERIEFILDAPDTVPEPAAPKPLPVGPAALAFEGVRFAYAPRAGGTSDVAAAAAPVALADVSLRVEPGETVALVGSTGAGKSTFISLLPRFYDPSAGRITLGGVDLREVRKRDLRERIAVVAQFPALFNTSIAENIRLGRPGASDAEVEQAARRAQIHDFIASLPEGYATIVGERGSSLSGGQRQRVAIARAFLKDAPILILDEATSALDSESEAKIQQALGELVRGRTTFMIAHRFSSIRDASRILVFEQGRITGDGPPAEILQNHPVARKLAELQRGGA